ncbi:MAG TPA: ATP synthase F0 subunit B [Pyrinomonadaceae bacterium]|nr:ATP synthase F0 subunit B [Pyrinomonadaceae bacterium]
MFLFFFETAIYLLAAASSGEGGFNEFYNRWLNIPGFELWKFLNLAIFLSILTYLVKKPLSDAFKAKRNAIRAELIRAEEEKQAALKKLTSVEAQLAGLENEKAAILKKANEEGSAESRRLREQAEADIRKVQEQSAGEIDRLYKQTMALLKRFSAEESVRRAELKLKEKIDTENDSRLVKSSIASIGGMKQA